METISSYDELLAYIRDSGLAHEPDPGAFAIKLPISKDPLEGVMFIRWQADQQVAHFLQSMDFDIPEDRLATVALAIAMLNHALVLPGFGVNVQARRCYFRFTMPFRPDGTLARTSIQGLFNLAVKTAAEHYATLRGVAEGADPTTVIGQPA